MTSTQPESAMERVKRQLAAIEELKASSPWVPLAGCSLDTHATKHNWVEKAGGLPQYICEIAKDIHEQDGKDIGTAISIAVSRCKVWAAGGGGVKPDTRAKAAAAIAQWEKMKASSHAK